MFGPSKMGILYLDRDFFKSMELPSMLAIRNLACWFVNTVTIFRKITAPTNARCASIAVFPQTFPLQLVTDRGLIRFYSWYAS
jgi:hypothetical protein